MKRYESIGELLIDYRAFNKLSQSDFAEKIDVDTRTIQRWERGETLVKSEKEEEIVVETFLPYQLIRNLNSAIVIPTYYDFRIRKYSLDEISNEFPDAFWFKKSLKTENTNIRKLDYEFDLKYLKRFLSFQKELPNTIYNTIEKAIEFLPELNSICTDDAGYYSGHSIVFPIKNETYKKLLNKELKEDELKPSDLVNYKNQETPVFYNFDISADNNFDIYYGIHKILKFFNNLEKADYIYCTYATRYDTVNVNNQIGLTTMWEELPYKDKMGFEIFPRFYSGNFKSFLKGSDI